MARRPMMAANWKMNKTVREAQEYTAALLPRAADAEEDVDVVVCAPHTCLHEVGRMADDSAVMAGAQNFYYEDSGAFTGEISAPMLLDVGARAVIVGHSERREVFGETDEMVARKAKRAVEADILPIICVGETKEERDAGGMWEKVSGQVGRVIEDPEDAQDAISKIRNLLGESQGDDFANNVRILYGGSVKPENAAEIMAQEDVDGALVGGASLEVESFVELIGAAQNAVAGTDQ